MKRTIEEPAHFRQGFAASTGQSMSAAVDDDLGLVGSQEQPVSELRKPSAVSNRAPAGPVPDDGQGDGQNPRGERREGPRGTFV